MSEVTGSVFLTLLTRSQLMTCTNFHPQKRLTRTENDELRSRSLPGPGDFISSAHRRQFSIINSGNGQNEIVERY